MRNIYIKLKILRIMKDITSKLIGLFKSGYCTPQIARISKKLRVLSTTLHYNIKKLESEGKIKAYKAVFDYSKIDLGFCTYALISLDPGEYADPEKISHQLAKYDEVEGVDIVTGDWEIIIKIRSKDQNDYFAFVKHALSIPGIAKSKSLVSFNQVKTEFVTLK